MTVLEQLYNGNISPSEWSVKNGSEYHKISIQLVKDIDDLMALMNDEEKQIYKDIENCNFRLNSISETEKFIEGFRLGVQIMCEITYCRSKNFK